MNNAVKFTPEGGAIQVALAGVESQAEIRVVDNGQGIDAQLLPNIFERFLQGDASASRSHGGLGLGLAIARQLIELHGGTIRAESRGPGTGATFIIDLPIAATKTVEISGQEPASPVTSRAAPVTGGSCQLDGLRVLLVDDDSDARRILSFILCTAGAVIEECPGVDLALASIQEFDPQVLVSDLGMPGQDGFDLIRRVRELGGRFQGLPAIALTALARSEDCRRALLAGFQMHLAKPVEPRELTAAVAALVGRTEKAL